MSDATFRYASATLRSSSAVNFSRSSASSSGSSDGSPARRSRRFSTPSVTSSCSPAKRSLAPPTRSSTSPWVDSARERTWATTSATACTTTSPAPTAAYSEVLTLSMVFWSVIGFLLFNGGGFWFRRLGIRTLVFFCPKLGRPGFGRFRRFVLTTERLVDLEQHLLLPLGYGR